MRDVVSHMNDDSALQDWMAPSTGVKELDTMLMAFGQHCARLLQPETSLRAVQHTRARDQRLASLGRMTARIAHEIRNPIAAVRPRAENALAGPPARQSDGASCRPGRDRSARRTAQIAHGVGCSQR